jgi:hypothetical protein
LQTFRISFFFGALLQKGICDRTFFFENAENLPLKNKSLLPALFNDKKNIQQKNN